MRKKSYIHGSYVTRNNTGTRAKKLLSASVTEITGRLGKVNNVPGCDKENGHVRDKEPGARKIIIARK